MDNKIDRLIKDALIGKTHCVVYSENIFDRIQTGIETTKVKKAKKYKQFSSGFNYKQFVVVACLFIACTTLIFVSSNQARAFASQTFENIKTIFTLEKVGDELQLVEKPINEVNLYHGISKSTEKSDEELCTKLGFKVHFPKTLGDSFKLENKSLRVTLKKQLDLETYSKLQIKVSESIEDDKALNDLNPYDPVREVSGTYTRPDGSTILITLSQAWSLSEIGKRLKEYENLKDIQIKAVKVGSSNGYWVQGIYPKYLFIPENEIEKSDMSAKPELKTYYIFYWEMSGVTYTINTLSDFDLSFNESIKLAEEFMKAN